MKTLNLISLIGLIIYLISCKETDEIKASEIANVWRLEEVYVNGQLQDSTQLSATILGIQENNSYYRNYVSGTWVLSGNWIEFSPLEELGLSTKRHQVLEHTGDLLLLESSMTEKEYLWDFEGVAEDEVVTTREKFVKD